MYTALHCKKQCSGSSEKVEVVKDDFGRCQKVLILQRWVVALNCIAESAAGQHDPPVSAAMQRKYGNRNAVRRGRVGDGGEKY